MVSSTNYGMRRIVVVRRAHYDNSGRFSVVPFVIAKMCLRRFTRLNLVLVYPS